MTDPAHQDDESRRDWRVEPCAHDPRWWSAGYTYGGDLTQHRGVFVPVHHWLDRRHAEIFCEALLAGCSRQRALETVLSSKDPTQ